MAQSASTESHQPPIFTDSSIPRDDSTQLHNSIGIQMTRAEIARQAWLDK